MFAKFQRLICNKIASSRFPEQVSSPVRLEGGRVYFLQAFLKEGGGDDHIKVAVKLPTGQMESPIPKANLYIASPSKLVVVNSRGKGRVRPIETPQIWSKVEFSHRIRHASLM